MNLEQTLQAMGINNLSNQGKSLPPIPNSDPASLNSNHYNSFYGYRPQEFWRNAEVVSEKVEDFKKCQHYLERQRNEVKCKKCNIGWIVDGTISTRDGKLFHDGQQLAL